MSDSLLPLSMGFSRQEYWSGLPFPSPGDLPNPGIEPRSPALQADALSSEPPGKPNLDNQPRQHIKKQRHYVATKVRLVKDTVFLVVMYGCESWTIKKAERMDMRVGLLRKLSAEDLMLLSCGVGGDS